MSSADQGEPKLIAVLKRAISDSGLSQAQLSKESGVSQGQLSRFLRGERKLSLDAAAKLFDYFGFDVVQQSKPPADQGEPAEEPPPPPPPPRRRRRRKPNK